MSKAIFFRITIIALVITWLPFRSSALNKRHNSLNSYHTYWQDKKDKRKDQDKDRKKPEVKEVPQSRKQGKPEEVKPDKRDKQKDNRRNR